MIVTVIARQTCFPNQPFATCVEPRSLFRLFFLPCGSRSIPFGTTGSDLEKHAALSHFVIKIVLELVSGGEGLRARLVWCLYEAQERRLDLPCA